jgi:hypothetical protein
VFIACRPSSCLPDKFQLTALVRNHQVVHCHCLQAFQLSEQAVTLFKDGWFCPESEPSGVSKMQNPKEPKVEQPLIVVSEYNTCSCLMCLLYDDAPTRAAVCSDQRKSHLQLISSLP